MGSVLGGITDAVGLTDYQGQDRADDRSAEAMAMSKENADRSYKLSTEELAFQKEQYAEWQGVYGELQEDIGEYFKNLTGDKIAADEVQRIQQEFQLGQRQTDLALSQRGLDQSGLSADLLNKNIYGASMAKAGARSGAEQKAMEQKMGFLGLGLGQGTQMLSTQASLAGSAASNSAGMAGSFMGSSVGYGNTAQKYSAANMGFTSDAFGTAIGYGTGTGDFAPPKS